METKSNDDTLMETGTEVEWRTVRQSGRRQAVLAQDTLSKTDRGAFA
jgi:hypothetical protein